MSLADRFWKKVNKDGPLPSHQPHLGQCWVWVGYIDRQGYGHIGLGSRSEGRARAHRVGWMLQAGSPPRQHVLHRCDNPACVRLSHLFEGTQSENLLDMAAKGRCNSPKVSGHLNVKSKLSIEQVAAVLTERGSQREIAARYGVDHTTIGDIKRGQSYKNTRDILTQIWKPQS